MFKVKALILMIVLSQVAQSIQVSPAFFTLLDVRLGENYPIKKELIIFNESNDSVEYKIDVSGITLDKVILEGYLPLPSGDFLSVEGEGTFIIPPRSKLSREMFLSIPCGVSYYNQAWEANVRVSSGNSTFRTAVTTRYFIETPSSPMRKRHSPSGELAVAPSSISLSSDSPKAEFRVYNNSGNSLELELFVFVPISKDGLTIESTPGWNFRPELLSAIELDKSTISIEPGKSKKVRIKKTRTTNIDGEVLIMISSEFYNRFIRVFVERTP